jgi:hypothetical protein
MQRASLGVDSACARSRPMSSPGSGEIEDGMRTSEQEVCDGVRTPWGGAEDLPVDRWCATSR